MDQRNKTEYRGPSSPNYGGKKKLNTVFGSLVVSKIEPEGVS